jgi:prepilin-type processing-associated H-X9-DG protein
MFPRDGNRTKGFPMNPNPTITRLEALALAAVILLTLGIVYPVATTARSGGKSTLCLANLNMLGRAWLAYAEDNSGKLVNGMVPRDSQYANQAYWLTTMGFGGPFKDNAWWVNPPHNASGVYTGDPIPCTLADEENGIRSGKLYPYVGTSAAYHCPADRSYLKTTNRGGKRNYQIPALMNGEAPNNVEWINRYSQIRNPSVKMIFLDGTDDRGWDMGSWMMNAGISQSSWIDLFTAWHNSRTTLGFADGHVEEHFWVDASTRLMAEQQRWGVQPGPGEGADIAYMASAYLPKR